MNRQDKEYLAWVRQQECVECRAPAPSVPHHPRGQVYGCGMGLKAPDWLAVPVCKTCHYKYHDKTFDDPQATQADWVVRTLILAEGCGMINRGHVVTIKPIIDPMPDYGGTIPPGPLRFGFETKDES